MAAYITSPTTGSITPLTNLDAVYGMALQYSRLLVGGANAKTHYDTFDKTYEEYGAIVADYKVRHAQSKPAQPLTESFGAPAYPQILRRFFGDWNDRIYEVEIRDADAHAVVSGATSFEVFVSQIVNSINEGERIEKDENYAKLFFNDVNETEDSLLTFNSSLFDESASTGVTGILAGEQKFEAFDNPSDDVVLTEIRNIVKDMTFNNGTYSSGFVCGADIRDLRIVVPFRWLNRVGVATLSRLFNMAEADLLAQIVETDTLESVLSTSGTTETKYGIIICHKNAIGRVVRYDSNMETFVRQRFSRWFGREVVDMYYYNTYEKAWAIVFNEVTNA